MSSKKLQGPLLYIEQPFMRTPQNLHMQEVFTSRQDRVQPEEVLKVGETINLEPILEPEVAESPVPIEMMQQEEPEQDQAPQSQEKRRPALSRVKPFKEMSLTERIDYLLDFPKVLPPVKCVFYTDDEKYLGVLVGYENDQVEIQVPNQSSNIIIPMEDLKNIIMIGIRR
ncbi:CotO family spore coat protein [Neobacillus muris]|uniref:CotO family spore coat protein n=1 Tax=Neobacillus muris TaxID=2941334 RepID=UPI0020411D7C|nr:CotO family spore coat protein [Neobacillus muris]